MGKATQMSISSVYWETYMKKMHVWLFVANLDPLITCRSFGLEDTAPDDTCYNSRRQPIFLPQNSDSGKQRILIGIIPFVK